MEYIREYQYRDGIEAIIERNSDVWANKEVFEEVKDELDEVYQKAVLFNELVHLFPQKEDIPSDEFFNDMGYIINKLKLKKK